MLTLGIETSCDETALALYQPEHGIVAEVLHSQVEQHQAYGGVIPELAARDHAARLLPLLQQLLKQAGTRMQDVDGIAYTRGPGLAPALLTGACFAQTLAFIQNIPAIGVHHMEAHLLAPMLNAEQQPEFPLIALLVSGGHSMLVKAERPGGPYQIIGNTRDDAAGEAFDKTARLLGLPYPGGPALAELATRGNADRLALPLPMPAGLDFSFSGLKTAVRTLLMNMESPDDQNRADIAAAFQQQVVVTLVNKCRAAITQHRIPNLLIAGGVSANQLLRSKLAQLDCNVYLPELRYCTDNGSMVAYAGWLRLSHNQRTPNLDIKPRWPLDELQAV